jgi:hypothetical protein
VLLNGDWFGSRCIQKKAETVFRLFGGHGSHVATLVAVLAILATIAKKDKRFSNQRLKCVPLTKKTVVFGWPAPESLMPPTAVFGKVARHNLPQSEKD